MCSCKSSSVQSLWLLLQVACGMLGLPAFASEQQERCLLLRPTIGRRCYQGGTTADVRKGRHSRSCILN